MLNHFLLEQYFLSCKAQNDEKMRNVRLLKDVLADCITDLCSGNQQLADVIDVPDASKSEKQANTPKRQYTEYCLEEEVEYQ